MSTNKYDNENAPRLPHPFMRLERKPDVDLPAGYADQLKGRLMGIPAEEKTRGRVVVIRRTVLALAASVVLLLSYPFIVQRGAPCTSFDCLLAHIDDSGWDTLIEQFEGYDDQPSYADTGSAYLRSLDEDAMLTYLTETELTDEDMYELFFDY